MAFSLQANCTNCVAAGPWILCQLLQIEECRKVSVVVLHGH
jgi:hypothetical protein